MEREIKIKDENIFYTLRTSRRTKRVGLSVYCDGSVVVTAPNFAPEGRIQDFIFEKGEWILRKIEYFKSLGKTVFIKHGKSEYLKHRERAKEIVIKRVPELNKVYGFNYNKISIKNQKSRWGSCSSKGNLNFNYKIALIPEKLADYIIVHELCHLGEFNHSKKFWELVASAVPDHIERRKELKKIGIVYK